MKKYIFSFFIISICLTFISCNQSADIDSSDAKSSCGCGESCPCIDVR